MRLVLAMAVALTISTSAAAQTTIPSAKPGIIYGKKVSNKKALQLPELEKKLEGQPEFVGKIEGKVVEVCKKKGCFMKLSRENGEPIMVNFKDYALFMPQDIVGKTVVVTGIAKVSETSVEQLRHFAQDAGKSKEDISKITQPKRDIEIVADGVLVVK